MIEQKGMTFDYDFCYSFSFLLSSFLRGKRKGKENNHSRGQKSCLSARSETIIQQYSKSVRDYWSITEIFHSFLASSSVMFL